MDSTVKIGPWKINPGVSGMYDNLKSWDHLDVHLRHDRLSLQQYIYIWLYILYLFVGFCLYSIHCIHLSPCGLTIGSVGIRPTKAFQAPTTELNWCLREINGFEFAMSFCPILFALPFHFGLGWSLDLFIWAKLVVFHIRDAESHQPILKYILHIHQHPTFTR